MAQTQNKRIHLKRSIRSIERPVDWQIVIENVPAGSPVIGADREYWGFSIFRGKGEENLFCGSADNPVTCAEMALEALEMLRQKEAVSDAGDTN